MYVLICQCKHVGQMAYMTNWYNLHHKTARGLILIIARSSNVVKITAGKLIQLSIATFGDVSKYIECSRIRVSKYHKKGILSKKN